MGLKAFFIKPFAAIRAKAVKKTAANALKNQEKTWQKLLQQGKNTAFGKAHKLEKINTYEEFKKHVPVRDYEELKPWFDRTASGEENVLWPGKPVYLAKTSGTTSGAKYIPITKESAPYHMQSARDAVFCHIAKTGNASVMDGRLIFLSGSPKLENKNGILTGRLSGISNHMVPGWLKKNQVPSWETNCIEDWEEKVDAIVKETQHLDMRLISGIPAWVQMYFEKLLEKSGKKTILELFPNFSVFVYGGVNYEPYRAKLESLMGGRIPSVETYPASEGFFAYSDPDTEEGLLLLTDNGIFYEFIPSEEYFDENPTRLRLHEVELNKNYALILTTNAGLWAYSIGDTVRFVSKNPYRILVTGRIKHYISAFGEHVIGEEVDYAMNKACEATGAQIAEFHVAPQVNPAEGELPYHEWFVEFSIMPDDMELFREVLDKEMCLKNVYYRDLIEGKILQPARVKPLEKDAFIRYMKSQGKLGGQNKVPRLGNDRSLAEKLI
ncbi:MAG: GH3 auxin-responsive promoter family protein [Flavobacteriales bacterium]|nr:GH3 auxin-responsive promoter family protein [Flavobacteriales bacterium]